MDDLRIRPAVTSDAGRIAAIYNHYVLNSTVTFDTAPKSRDEREEWLAARSVQHPVFVCETSDGIIAWGALSPFRERPAWARTVEIAVYVEESHVALGVGPKMLAFLIDEARRLGHHVLVSQIVSENAPSLKTVQRAGFELVGTLREVGRKFDRWLDVVIMQLTLDDSGE